MILFGVLSVVVIAIRVLVRGLFLGPLGVEEIVDVVLSLPLFIGFVFFVNKSLSKTADSSSLEEISSSKLKKTNALGLISLFILILGYGIHLAANAINVYITELNDYKDLILEEVYNLIFFYDEFLGHLFIFLGFIGLSLVLVIKELYMPNKIIDVSNLSLITSYILWFFLGGILSIISIEATYFIKFMIGVSTLSLIVLQFLFIKRGIILKSIIYASSIRFMCVGLIIFSILYYIIVGEFIPPSDIFSV
jgi:hypothetical protein